MKPARILLAWEDRYFEGLRALSRAATRSVRAELGVASAPRIFDDSIQGYGGAGRYLGVDWPRMRSKGLPHSSGPIDHLVIVLDADTAHHFLDNLPRPPEKGATGAWHARATSALEARLRASAPRDPDRVHGVLLRWAKETLVLAAHDQTELLAALDRKVPIEAARSMLYRGCNPDPRQVEDAAFVDVFRSPKACMADLAAAFGLGRAKKSDLRFDDLLGKLARADIATPMNRVPDLRRLAEKIVTLASPVSGSV